MFIDSFCTFLSNKKFKFKFENKVTLWSKYKKKKLTNDA